MVSMLYKWLMIFFLSGFNLTSHPIFVSVTEIEHNATAKTLEISVKIFTDDFETSLRKAYNTKVNLLDLKAKPAMNPLVNGYIQKHFNIKANGKAVQLEFLGFEQQEEGIMAFFEVKNIASIKTIDVTNSILYEYKDQQMGIIHVLVNGNRKSTRLNNPDEKASFVF